MEDKRPDVKLSNRTCPNCDYEYSKKEYFTKLYFKAIWKGWNCESCGIRLKFDLKRRVFNAFVLAITLLVIFQIEDYFASRSIYVIVSILILLLVATTLFLFVDKIKVSNHKVESI